MSANKRNERQKPDRHEQKRARALAERQDINYQAALTQLRKFDNPDQDGTYPSRALELIGGGPRPPRPTSNLPASISAEIESKLEQLREMMPKRAEAFESLYEGQLRLLRGLSDPEEAEAEALGRNLLRILDELVHPTRTAFDSARPTAADDVLLEERRRGGGLWL